MKFEEIWQELINKDPSLAEPCSVVKFDPSRLRQLLHRAYEAGFERAANCNRDEPRKTSFLGVGDLFWW